MICLHLFLICTAVPQEGRTKIAVCIVRKIARYLIRRQALIQSLDINVDTSTLLLSSNRNEKIVVGWKLLLQNCNPCRLLKSRRLKNALRLL